MASYYVRATGGSDSNGGTSHADGWATLQHALDNMTTGQANQLNCSGSFTLSSSLDFTTYSTITGTNYLLFKGYTSTENDGGIANMDCGTVPFINSTTQDNFFLENLYFNNWGSGYCVVGDNNISINYCEFDGEGARVRAIDLDNENHIMFNKIHSMTPSTNDILINSLTGTLVYGNYIHSETGSGGTGSVHILLSTGGRMVGNVLNMDVSGGDGVMMAGDGSVAAWNTIFNQFAGTNSGIVLTSTAEHCAVLNNIVCGFSGAGGVGIDLDSGSTSSLYGGNKYWNNTTDLDETGVVAFDLGDNESLGANPFNSTGNTDHNDDDFQISAASLAFPSQLYNPSAEFGSRNEDYSDAGFLARQNIPPALIFSKRQRVM